MTAYRFPEGVALVFGGSGGLGSGVVDLLSKCGTNVAFTYLNNKEAIIISSYLLFIAPIAFSLL